MVGMLIDLRSSPGKISFTMDGENCGVAYDNVYTPVRPYVSLCLEQHQNGRQQCDAEKVTLVNAYSIDTANSIAPISRMSVECARNAWEAILFCENRASTFFVDKCWNLYKLWRHNKWSVFTTTDGEIPIEVDRTIRGGEVLKDQDDTWQGHSLELFGCEIKRTDTFLSLRMMLSSDVDEKEEEKEEDEMISKDEFVKQMYHHADLSKCIKQACEVNSCSPYELTFDQLRRQHGDSSVAPAFIALLYLNMMLKDSLQRIDFVTSTLGNVLRSHQDLIFTHSSEICGAHNLNPQKQKDSCMSQIISQTSRLEI